MIGLLLNSLLFYAGVSAYIVSDRNGQRTSRLLDPFDLSGDDESQLPMENPKLDLDYALEHWTGRWMPDENPGTTTAANIISDHPASEHGVKMGPSSACDDGKTNLQVDWNHSPVDHTCYGQNIVPDASINAAALCETIPKYYQAAHACMNDTLEYGDAIPTYGIHRPVWPVYGEYLYLPKQRWIHSLEHGAVVMLYHPCANPLELERLKGLVRGCLRRHIITPYSLLSEDRPLALVTWGCRLEMSIVKANIVQEFIRSTALRGPEAISRDGLFADGIISQAEIVTDDEDTTLCPQNTWRG